MNSFELLKALINELDKYEDSAPDKKDLSLQEFITFLSPTMDLDILKNSFVKSATVNLEENKHSIDNNLERVIAQHILFMYRYIKLYSKMAFSDGNIKTIEDFSFLITLLQQSALPKSELIRRNVYEKSSGIETINRLIKSRLLSQKDNPEDKRSQLVELTDIGRASLYKVFGKMNDLGLIAAGDLTENEKKQLATLLKKLDKFHFNNYHDKSSEELTDYLPD